MGYDGEAEGANQMWRLCSLVGCPSLRGGGRTPFEEAYPNANPWVVQAIIQFKGNPTPREQTILM